MARRRHGRLLPLLLLLAGCGSQDGADPAVDAPPPSGSVSLTDARGETLTLPAPATRILSLVPSVTETLHRMGAAGLLVGRTDYDTLPDLQGLPSVGGGLGPSLEIIRTLEPQVVVTFAGESDPRTARGLAAFAIPVFAVRPDRLADVPAIIRQMGTLTGREARAQALVDTLEAQLASVRAAVAGRPALRAAYLLGGSPPLAAGPGTFISDLLELAGAENVLHDLTGLYAPVSPEVLRDRELDVVLLGEGAPLDPRIAAGRRVVEIPAWVEIPGPYLGEAAWVVARALRPQLPGGS
ncbi:MAG TPA: helical backbone metal receptor [Longimicrobiales bacterium]|nr:helical backbone metal receptor [Longimicrobiales bacterium]